MAGLTAQEAEALTVFKQKLVDHFGKRLESVLLFGSKARGDAHEESDVDVLVILHERSWQDDKQVFSMLTETFLETDVYLSPKVYDSEDVNKRRARNNMFFQFVDQDAKSI